jgi:hypothetical protein
MVMENFKSVSSFLFCCFGVDSKKGGGIGVPGGGPGSQAAQDPIGALQNLARQGMWEKNST